MTDDEFRLACEDLVGIFGHHGVVIKPAERTVLIELHDRQVITLMRRLLGQPHPSVYENP